MPCMTQEFTTDSIPYTDSIVCGDCVELMKTLPDGCIDLTVTSPPYDGLRKYKGFSFDFESTAKELYRVTKPGGVVVWIVSDTTKDGSESGTSFRQALFFMDIGFNLHDTMIYEKAGCGASGSKKCYLQNFDYMFVFSKGKIKTYNLLCDRKNKVVRARSTNVNRDRNNVDTGRKYIKIVGMEYGRRFNVWKYDPNGVIDPFARRHPAPFPKQLAKDHILSWSNEGDIVLDPMMGSGTTAAAALETGRHYIGFDVASEYVEISKERIQNALNKSDVLFTKTTQQGGDTV